jgi:hypothetical protein
MPLRNRVIISCAVFIAAYSIFLFLWIQIKPFYGNILTHAGGSLAGSTAGAELEKVIHEKDTARVTYARTVMRGGNVGEVLLDFKLSVSNYSFNVPLSFGLVAGLFVFFRWRWRYLLEVSFILVFVHILYIYSYCTLNLFKELTKAGLKNPSASVQFTLQFLWAFTDNMVIRFEPFLVSAYLWLRNRAVGSDGQKHSKKMEGAR